VPGVRSSLELYRAEYEALATNESPDAQPQQNLVHMLL
jgi:hypothetical protein